MPFWSWSNNILEERRPFDGALADSVTLSHNITCVTEHVITPTDVILLVGHSNGSISIVIHGNQKWKLSSELQLHESAVSTISSMYGSEFFISCTNNGEVAMWDPNSFRCLRSLRLKIKPTAVGIAASAPDGALIGASHGLLMYVTLTHAEAIAQLQTEVRSIVSSSTVSEQPVWWVAERSMLHLFQLQHGNWKQVSMSPPHEIDCMTRSCCGSMLVMYGSGILQMFDELSCTFLHSIAVKEPLLLRSPSSASLLQLTSKPMLSLQLSGSARDWIRVVDETVNESNSNALVSANMQVSQLESQVQILLRSEQRMSNSLVECQRTFMNLGFAARDVVIQLEHDARKQLHQAYRLSRVFVQRQRLAAEQYLEEELERKMDVIRMLERRLESQQQRVRSQSRESASPSRRSIEQQQPPSRVSIANERPQQHQQQHVEVIRRVEEQLKMANLANKSLENECERLRSVHSALLQSREREQQLTQELQQLRDHHQAVSEQLLAFQEHEIRVAVATPISDIGPNNESLRLEIAHLREELELSEKRVHEAKMMYTASQGELKTQTVLLKGEIQRMNLELQSMQGTLTVAPNCIEHEMDIRNLKLQLETVNRENQVLSAQIQEKTNSLHQYQLAADGRLQAAQSAHDLAVADCRKRNQQLEEIHQRTNEELINCRNRCREYEQTIAKYEHEDKQKAIVESEHALERRKLQSTITQLRQENLDLDSRETAQLGELDKKLRSLKSRHETLQSAHRKKERENEALSQLCERQASDAALMIQQQQELQREILKLRNSASTKTETLSLHDQIQILHITEQYSRATIMADFFENINPMCLYLVHPYRVNFASLVGDRDRLRQLVTQLSGDLDKHKLTIEQMQSEHNKIVAEFHAEEFRKRDVFFRRAQEAPAITPPPHRSVVEHSQRHHQLSVAPPSSVERPANIVNNRQYADGASSFLPSWTSTKDDTRYTTPRGHVLDSSISDVLVVQTPSAMRIARAEGQDERTAHRPPLSSQRNTASAQYLQLWSHNHRDANDDLRHHSNEPTNLSRYS